MIHLQNKINSKFPVTCFLLAVHSSHTFHKFTATYISNVDFFDFGFDPPPLMDFFHNLWDFFWILTLFRNKIFLYQIFFWLKKFSDPIFFDPKRSSSVFWCKPTKPKSFESKTFQAEHFRPKSCFMPKHFGGEKTFFNQLFLKVEFDTKDQVLFFTFFPNSNNRNMTLIFMIYGTDIGEIYATFGSYMAYIWMK